MKNTLSDPLVILFVLMPVGYLAFSINPWLCLVVVAGYILWVGLARFVYWQARRADVRTPVVAQPVVSGTALHREKQAGFGKRGGPHRSVATPTAHRRVERVRLRVALVSVAICLVAVGCLLIFLMALTRGGLLSTATEVRKPTASDLAQALRDFEEAKLRR